ncbi:MAG: hypothetical protein IIW77_04840 [Bacteroidaceae bacterium]|nr:hypothetical protein [Bacteroidaceae bacterium]
MTKALSFAILAVRFLVIGYFSNSATFFFATACSFAVKKAMKKKGLKYLYGTKQENKNEYEKRMKRYFISGIPCFSEHIDRTGDVKVKDDKAEYQNYPDKKYFDIPVYKYSFK